jgi:hypothetical protein
MASAKSYRWTSRLYLWMITPKAPTCLCYRLLRTRLHLAAPCPTDEAVLGWSAQESVNLGDNRRPFADRGRQALGRT